jgi:signal transduction histidine kinase
MKRIAALLVEALGTNLVYEIECAERRQHVRATATISILVGCGFVIFNLVSPLTQLLGFTELACILLFFVPAALLNNQPQRIDAAETMLMLGALGISSALVILGGVEGTGLLWVYCMPFLAFFIKGQRRGWYYSLAFYGWHIVCLQLIAPQLSFAYPYSPVVRLHFLLSMGFYVLVAAAFNHARSRFETALQQRKEEAEAASQAKSRFLAAASHDLRQPAHALGLFVARLNQLPNSPQTSIFQFRYEPEGTGVRIVSAGRLIGLKGEV